MEISLDALLRLAWVAGIIPILVASAPIPPLRRFRELLSSFAGRGKTFSSSSSSKFTVPQKYFLHFYVVAVVWTSCLLGITWFYACGRTGPSVADALDYSTVASNLMGSTDLWKTWFAPAEYRERVWRSVFLLLLMEAQVLKRLYETLYVFDYGRSAQMHVIGYLTGLFYYVAAPLSLCSQFTPEISYYVGGQVAEFIVKDRAGMPVNEFNLTWLDLWDCVNPLLQLRWFQWIGMVIFIWGWIHQLRCHAILGSLRKQPGANNYVIPCGDWFEIVSCPHYFAEIVIYAGILVSSGGLNLTIWLLFMFVVSNLVFASAETHRWYHSKFENYPISRRAIFPLIY